MQAPRIKICCIASAAEAQLAIAHGAAALGLVGPMPSGPGVIEDSLIREIAAQTPPGISSFLLTSETAAADIIAHHRKVSTSVIQLVDAVAHDAYAEIRAAAPAVKLVQVIHVVGAENVDEALRIAPYVDALLLDSGNPRLAVKELGGTGRTHNWQLSREIVERAAVPVYLAGGLKPENVREAIETVKPFGLDLCSGVRTHGKLDAVKLAAFFKAAHSAD
ncbi:MAG: phosphoribosylanthranilate isomerase [Spirochaetes bacterium]|nr:phosphoribosylanthranilate isomerase [Spirochaetota bacterium]